MSGAGKAECWWADNRQLGLKLKIDGWVLELVETGGPLGMQVLGPFRIVGFEGTGDIVALLETGSTLFRDKVVCRRLVSNLAKYHRPGDK